MYIVVVSFSLAPQNRDVHGSIFNDLTHQISDQIRQSQAKYWPDSTRPSCDNTKSWIFKTSYPPCR